MPSKVLTPWVYEGLDELDLSDYYGFVYLIIDLTNNKKYIGRKYLWSRRAKKIKGKRRRSITVKESDWRYYKSSSDVLKQQISEHGLNKFSFIILYFCKTKGMTNYSEVKEQFARDVLYARLPNGDFEYYNNCILNRYYRLDKY